MLCLTQLIVLLSFSYLQFLVYRAYHWLHVVFPRALHLPAAVRCFQELSTDRKYIYIYFNEF